MWKFVAFLCRNIIVKLHTFSVLNCSLITYNQTTNLLIEEIVSSFTNDKSSVILTVPLAKFTPGFCPHETCLKHALGHTSLSFSYICLLWHDPYPAIFHITELAAGSSHSWQIIYSQHTLASVWVVWSVSVRGWLCALVCVKMFCGTPEGRWDWAGMLACVDLSEKFTWLVILSSELFSILTSM